MYYILEYSDKQLGLYSNFLYTVRFVYKFSHGMNFTICIHSKTITWENIITNRTVCSKNLYKPNRFRTLNQIVISSKRFAPVDQP